MADKQKEAEREKRRKEREERKKLRDERQKLREEKKKKEQEKEDNKPVTIAGYTLGEILKAPLKAPDEKEVGKRSSASDDS